MYPRKREYMKDFGKTSSPKRSAAAAFWGSGKSNKVKDSVRLPLCGAPVKLTEGVRLLIGRKQTIHIRRNRHDFTQAL
jgi:hypothetical protein